MDADGDGARRATLEAHRDRSRRTAFADGDSARRATLELPDGDGTRRGTLGKKGTFRARRTNKRGSMMGQSNKRGSMMGSSMARQSAAEAEDGDDVPELALTLAGIFGELQEMEAQEQQERLQKLADPETGLAKGLSTRRNTGPRRTRGGRRLTDPMATPKGPEKSKAQRNVAEQRDTDFRGYESLQDILHSTEEWNLDADHKPDTPPSRPVTVPAVPGKPPTRRRPQPTVTDRWDLRGKRIYPKFELPSPSNKARKSRYTTFNLENEDSNLDSSEESASGSSSDSDESSSQETEHSGTSEELLGEIAGPAVSEGWGMLLAFAKDAQDGNAGGLCAGDDLAAWASAKDKPQVPRREVNFNSRPMFMSEFGQPRDEVAHSPLRPGVYVGHGDNETMLVEAAKNGKRPPGLPDAASNSAQALVKKSGGVLRVGRESGWSSLRRNKVLQMSDKSSRLAKALNLIMEEEEDERRHEDSRNYQAWRKKVIECARNMRLEVDRFQLEPRIV